MKTWIAPVIFFAMTVGTHSAQAGGFFCSGEISDTAGWSLTVDQKTIHYTNPKNKKMKLNILNRTDVEGVTKDYQFQISTKYTTLTVVTANCESEDGENHPYIALFRNSNGKLYGGCCNPN